MRSVCGRFKSLVHSNPWWTQHTATAYQATECNPPAHFDPYAVCDCVTACGKALHFWGLRLVGLLDLSYLVTQPCSILCMRQVQQAWEPCQLPTVNLEQGHCRCCNKVEVACLV